MFATAFAEGLVQLFEEFALVLGELYRGLYAHVAIQVAGVAASHALDAFAAQAEGFAGLRAFGDVDAGFAGAVFAKGGHFDLAA